VATISGLWDSQRNTTRTNFPELLKHGGESVISGIPTWSSLVFATSDGHAYTPGVDASEVKSYYQTLSLKDGVVRTVVEWEPAKSGLTLVIDCSVVAHMTRINLGMIKCEVTPSESGDIILTDILDGQGAQRTSFVDKGLEKDDTIWTSVKPAGIDNVTAFEVSTLDFDFTSKQGLVVEGSRKNAEQRAWVSGNESTISQEFTLETTKGETLTILKYVGIASTDAFPKDTSTVAQNAATEAKSCGWDTLIQEHRAGWEALWEEADIVIPGPEDIEEMQIAVRASLFHLLSNIRPGDEGKGIGYNSIAVGGLASDSYAGLVFWDADTWMLPGLLALHPERAAAINNYRYRLLPQAKKNAETFGLPGALYPWTSGRFGNCTGTGPCKDYEYHLNSDISLVQWHQFLHSGDKTWLRERGWPIISAVADMWTGLVKKANASGEDGLEAGMYTLQNMTDPVSPNDL
jgi:trehalose/maltose hydrolase-like predicted phosphorylase